jgi:hypothetical protein
MSVAFAPPATPVTVAMNEQLRTKLTVPKTSSLGLAPTGFLYRQMAMRSQIDNLVMRRHIHQRMVELTLLAR